MNQHSGVTRSHADRTSKPGADPGGSILPLLLEDLVDPNPRVRVLAVREMSDCRDLVVIDRLIELAQGDPDLEVRCAAIAGLGHFIYRGGISAYDPETDQEIVCSDECLPKEDFERVYEFLLSVYGQASRPLDERRSAVEALSFFGNETVEGLIADLYAMPERAAKRSALTAMGRNGSLRWAEILRREFHNPDRELRLEAIVAAGETSLESLGKDLWRLTYADDREIMLAAVWSLGQTGWDGAFERLDELSLDDDAVIAETADEALDEWTFYNGLSSRMDDDRPQQPEMDDLDTPIY